VGDTRFGVGRRALLAASMQNKANFRETEVGVSPLCARDYENRGALRLGRNKPNMQLTSGGRIGTTAPRALTISGGYIPLV
jgi:hypothetical protein